MFGNKESKLKRLWQILNVLEASDGVKQAELARKVGTSPANIHKDLSIIEEKTGSLLSEDDDGRLYIFKKGRR